MSGVVDKMVMLGEATRCVGGSGGEFFRRGEKSITAEEGV